MLPPLSMASAQRQHHLHAQCRCCSLQGHQGLPVHKYLLFIAQVNAEGKSSCAFKDCPDSPTADVVRAFAESNQVFSTKMNNVYQTWMIWKLSHYVQGLDGGIWESFCQDACAWQQQPPRPSINRTLEMWNKTDKGQWLYWIYPKTPITPTHFDQSCLCF